MEQFSKDADKLLSKAESIAFGFNHSFVASEHLLLAILKDKNQPLTRELNRQKIDCELVTKKIKNLFPKKDKDPLYMEYTIELKLLISKTTLMFKDKKDGAVTPLSLSYAILVEENSGAYNLLKKLKVDIDDLKESLFVVKKNSELDTIQDLHRLGTTKKDPLIGRKNELIQLINSLSRRNKPNAILVGEPGVGKTAIVEELAYLLENDQVPSLMGKKIYELDVASTVGGTKYRGEFEEKIKKIIKKVCEDGSAILFIDEIHNIVHAGGAEGAIDASNILKPYLSRGDIQVIGATTEDEFEAVFEKDKPLKRRFQVIKVYQTSIEETKDILHKLKPIYENYYNTTIEDSVLDNIVDLASIYLPDLSFPDKAIDILDNTLVSNQKVIDKSDILNTMSMFYKLQNSSREDIEKLLNVLKEKIIGQEDALEKIRLKLLELDLNIKDENRPLMSLFFIGPSGVGKTYVSKLIGEKLFSNENTYVLNMALYQDAYSLKELLTSNRGLYGEESSAFIKKIKSHPNLCLILEDIDKAHNEVLDFFQTILDTGGFYDLKGKYVDMHSVFIIMTSNYGFKGEDKFSTNIKRDSNHLKNINNILANRFREEFISRLDGIVEFDYLSNDSLSKIVDNYLLNVEDNMKYDLNIDFSQEEYKKRGVFALKQAIKKVLIDNSTKKILN